MVLPIHGYVELPGSGSNHHDFQFPWSSHDASKIPPSGKPLAQTAEKSYALPGQFIETGLISDPQSQVTPDPHLKMIFVTKDFAKDGPRVDVHTALPRAKHVKKGVKSSFKLIGDLVKQAIVNLEEKAYPNTGDSSSLHAHPSTPNYAPSLHPMPKKALESATGERRVASTPKMAQTTLKEGQRPSQHQVIGDYSKIHKNRKISPVTNSSLRPTQQHRLVSNQDHKQEGRFLYGRKVGAGARKKEKIEAKGPQRRVEPKKSGAQLNGSDASKYGRMDGEKPSQSDRKLTQTSSLGVKKAQKVPDLKWKSSALEINEIRTGADENLLSTLRRFDTVFLLDDSASMATNGHWEAAVNVLQALAEISAYYDKSGIDLRFLNSPKHFKSTKNVSLILQKLKSLEPNGGSTPTESKLEDIIRPYIENLEAQKLKNQALSKPLNILIITDGVPDDVDSFIAIISQISSRLDAGHFPLNQIGIQFIQIGEERRVSRVLKVFDNHLQKRYGITRDMIVCLEFPHFQQCFIWKNR